MKQKLALALCLAAVAAEGTQAAVPLSERMPGGRPIPRQWRHKDHSPEITKTSPNTPSRTQRKAFEAEGLGVYGYVSYSDYWDFVPEWVELSPYGFNHLWDDPDFGYKGEVTLEAGWVRNGRLCGFCPKTFGLMMNGYWYKEYDLTTGEVLLAQELDLNSANRFLTVAYSPEKNILLGYGETANGEAMIFKASPDNPTDVQPVIPLADNDQRHLMSIVWNPSDQRFVGINTSGMMMEIKTDGTATQIYRVSGTEEFEPYCTGLGYDATNRLYYWSLTDDIDGWVSTIDAATGNVTGSIMMPQCETFGVLWCDAKVVDAAAPGMPSISSVAFEGPAQSGTVAFTLPTEYSDGSPLEGEMEWTSTLDGAEWTTGTGTTGQTINVAYANISEGLHTFGLYASWLGNDGAEAQTDVYVGYDTPAAPRNVTLTTSRVSWEAVTTGAHGGYIDPQAISYDVAVNGVAQGNTTGTSLAITLDTDREFSMIQATVTAVYSGRYSEPGISNSIAFGSALNLPVEFTPTEAEFMLMTTSDDNNDGFGWHYVGNVTDPDFPCLDSDYSHFSGPADDWVFLPAINFDSTEAFYNFSMRAKGRKIQMQPEEYFEVMMGSSADAAGMTHTLLPRTKGQVGFVKYEKYFQVPEAGEWYIGIHAVSDFDMYGVRVRDINVHFTDIDEDSPAAPANVTCVAGPEGALQALVEFNMPTANVRGDRFDSSVSLRVRVEGETFIDVTGSPGERCQATVRTKQGENKIILTPYNGESTGLPAGINVYTGVDTPCSPETVFATASEDNMSAVLLWDPPLAGENDGYINTSSLTYRVYLYNGDYGWMPYSDPIRGTEYVFHTEPGAPLANYRLGVNCENEAGSSAFVTSVSCVLGTPYELPYEEEFDSSGPSSGPWVTSGSDVCNWGFADLSEIAYDWADLTGGALVGMPRQTGKGTIKFPKIGTETESGETLSITVRTWAGDQCPESMQLYATSYFNEEPVLLGSIAKASGFTDSTFAIPASLTGLKWIQPIFEASFSKADQLCVIDRIMAGYNSGVATLQSGKLTLEAGRGYVKATSPEAKEVRVMTPDGRLAAIGMANPEIRFDLPAGIYLVDRTKVIVR